MRASAAVLAALVFVSAGLRAEDMDLRMMLTIDDQDVGYVATGADVRRALAQCDPPKSCNSIYLHREPQIDYGAGFENGGYTISHRTGPPGPEFDAKRKGTGSPDHFSTAEMVEITANYLDGRDTAYVEWASTPLFE
jgi:hypothetical protein